MTLPNRNVITTMVLLLAVACAPTARAGANAVPASQRGSIAS